MKHKHTNELINESSPYLLQHAHNPVEWRAWNDETLALAKEEDKLILISVGYAACHWCHVMESESFEDEEVAELMNAHFINIKVDREERPDVDRIYMNAVNLMTGSGGWPLNVVALPDGRPFWGGTYFGKEDWMKALLQIVETRQNNPKLIREYAANLKKGIKSLDLVKPNTNEAVFTLSEIDEVVAGWKQRLDDTWGGTQRTPKFMMPVNYNFLMRYAWQKNDIDLQRHIWLTLTKMAWGGLYDQVGGGFARYSTDGRWHIPHFEKMLYDNAQLISLYSDAFKITGDELYQQVVFETIDFMETELQQPEGAFCSSLDADSIAEDGTRVEGAYYVWTEAELELLLQDDFEHFKEVYNINQFGQWEDENYVLIKNEKDSALAEKLKISVEELKKKKEEWKKLLSEQRAKRNRPPLDDKYITSWNGLLIKGYADAYRAFKSDRLKEKALQTAEFLLQNQQKPDGGLYHTHKKGKSKINGYLEDYATVIEAFLQLYQITFDYTWIKKSDALTAYCFDNFFDENSGLFFFTSREDAPLVSRSLEKEDNVIASSNSIMAKNLFLLAHYTGKSKYNKQASTMLNTLKPEIMRYPSAYANWLDLMLNYTNSFYEVAITGEEAQEYATEFGHKYLPNILLAVTEKKSEEYLLQNRYVNGQTLIYVCVNNTCKLPVKQATEAMKFIKKE